MPRKRAGRKRLVRFLAYRETQRELHNRIVARNVTHHPQLPDLLEHHHHQQNPIDRTSPTKPPPPADIPIGEIPLPPTPYIPVPLKPPAPLPPQLLSDPEITGILSLIPPTPTLLTPIPDTPPGFRHFTRFIPRRLLHPIRSPVAENQALALTGKGDPRLIRKKLDALFESTANADVLDIGLTQEEEDEMRRI